MSKRGDMIGRRTAALALLGLALLLAGCGRKSSPKHPEGSTYQGTIYPTRPAMGLPKDDSPAASPEDEAPEDDDSRRPVGAYSAPPPGMR